VTAVAVALGAGAGLDLARCLLLGAAVLSGQLSIGWLNDLLDRERDAAAGRTDKPIARGEVSAHAVRIACATAAAVCVPLSLGLGWRAGVVHLVAVAGGWSYDLWLKATWFSPLPYALSFGLLPSVVTLSMPHPAWAPWWATVAGSLLGLGIHGANALPDIDDDTRLGARGFPARVGARATRVLTAASLLAASLLLVLAPDGPPTVWGWIALLAAVVLAAAAVGHAWPATARTAFALVVALALIDVTVLVAHAGDWVVAVGTLRT
jgi:4-hydroxybenzoate polyprenyltransferase